MTAKVWTCPQCSAPLNLGDSRSGARRCDYCGASAERPDAPKAPDVHVNVAHAVITGTETTADLLVVRRTVVETVESRAGTLERRRADCEPPDFLEDVRRLDAQAAESEGTRRSEMVGVAEIGAATLKTAGASLLALFAFTLLAGFATIFKVNLFRGWLAAAVVYVGLAAPVVVLIERVLRRRALVSDARAEQERFAAQRVTLEREADARRAAWPAELEERRLLKVDAQKELDDAVQELGKIEAVLRRRSIDPHPTSIAVGAVARPGRR